MATAVFEYTAAAPAKSSAASISWFRRRDPYVLLPLVLIHAVIAGPAIWGTFSVPNTFPRLHELFMGVLLAQCLLLGIWAALGCLPLIVRWALVSGAFLLGLTSLAIAMRQVLNLWVEVLELGLIGAMLVTFFAALLLPLRGLLAWRLDFDPSRHASLTGRRGQIGIMSIAAFSVAIAAPLTIVRLLQQSLPSVDGNSMLFGVIAVLTSLSASACPVAYSLLNGRRLLLVIGVGPCWCAIVALAHVLLSLLIPGLSFFDDDHTWSTDWQEIAAFHAGIAACIILTFTALRLAGLKLFALRYADHRLADPRPSAAPTASAFKLPRAA